VNMVMTAQVPRAESEKMLQFKHSIQLNNFVVIFTAGLEDRVVISRIYLESLPDTQV
jgi:hypothetical protein